VLFVFAQFYQMHPSPRLLKDFYESMIRPMADFLATYIDDVTGLPKPSYDLWEEVFLTTTYTTSVVYAALLAAAELAEAAEDSDSAVKWRSAADDIMASAHKHLYNRDRKAFYKGIIVKDGQIRHDETLDLSSVFGAFMFGLFPVGSEELTATIDTISHTFGVTDERVGLPRYENDNYRRVNDDITGNWWIITTLWLAQYHIETGNREKADQILAWVLSHTSTTGVLPEQVSPIDDSFISVAPLTWSHAEYVASLLDMIIEKK
jgi:GH15 family glucan-1,4-alpha-glucosidase